MPLPKGFKMGKVGPQVRTFDVRYRAGGPMALPYGYGSLDSGAGEVFLHEVYLVHLEGFAVEVA